MQSVFFDKLAMLLSADWFFDLWPIVGLSITEASRVKVRNDTRAIVKELLDDSGDYWNSSFENSRVNATKSKVIKAISSVRPDISRRISDHLSYISKKNNRPAIKLLLDDMASVNDLISENLAETMLSEKDDSVVKNILIENKISRISVEKICMESASSWDVNLRKFTPDLPTFLSDFAVVDLDAENRFWNFWTKLEKLCDRSVRLKIIDCYQQFIKIDGTFSAIFPVTGYDE